MQERKDRDFLELRCGIAPWFSLVACANREGRKWKIQGGQSTIRDFIGRGRARKLEIQRGAGA